MMGSFVGSCTGTLLPWTDEDKDFLVETPHLSPPDLLWDSGRESNTWTGADVLCHLLSTSQNGLGWKREGGSPSSIPPPLDAIHQMWEVPPR